ncbi:MAG: hypothetical protein EOP06_04270 [Proteobacteria bacterium]|nr:MAG: hypothetical protein EOP06_04270 [Pseudomonadota bacterium]
MSKHTRSHHSQDVPPIRLDDKSLFGNDAGEDEDESVLVSYFVEQAAYADFLNPEVRLQVARGRKGMGKSALLVRFAHELKEASTNPIVVSVVPSSLVALKEPPATENAVILENYWKQVICASINMQLANEIGFAWKDDDIVLVETAELAGFKGQNIVGALISRMLNKITLGALEVASKPKTASNHEQLLQRAVLTHSARQVWFLLDDVDTKFQNTTAQQAYISAFFSAARFLVRTVEGLGIRATVRNDVWSSLRGAEDLDKFEQYITEIQWSAPQQKDILANRILAYIKRNFSNSTIARNWNITTNGEDLIELVFSRRMRWGTTYATSTQVLRILGSGRPRWMAQLCRLAGIEATKDNSHHITIQEINKVMGEFGRRRLSDLYKEHQHQFPDLKRLIESFSNGPRRFTTDELVARITLQYVKSRGAVAIPEVDGRAFQDSWQLAHFVYKCGFINGHNSQNATLDVPEFISYDARPDLLEVGTNLDDGMTWEIQPAYRNILRTR